MNNTYRYLQIQICDNIVYPHIDICIDFKGICKRRKKKKGEKSFFKSFFFSGKSETDLGGRFHFEISATKDIRFYSGHFIYA